MKIFAIRDETDQQHKDLAYLVYYEKAKQFYIELPENADPWETPLLLSSLAKRGKKQSTPIGAAFGYSFGLYRQTVRIWGRFCGIMVWKPMTNMNC